MTIQPLGRRTALAAATLLLTVACADPSPPSGMAVYTEPAAAGNTFACATCHALEEPAVDGVRRAGHSLAGATARPSYKNGELTRFVDAANVCRQDWMGAPPWTDADAEFTALVEFLELEAPGDSAPLSFTIAAPATDLAGGDGEAGRTLFNESCMMCHGTDAVGSERAPALNGEFLDPETIARRVRTGGPRDSVYEGLTGGRMPFWAADRLSDAELRDLVAFLDEHEPPDEDTSGSSGGGGAGTGTGTDDGDGGGDGNDAAAAGDCGGSSTHPKVGQVTELNTFAHGVDGTAEIVDDCTIRITDFDYDGGGIVVRVYGGLGGDYENGFALAGDELTRAEPYDGETVEVALPADKTLDDLDGISIWCVTVGVDFGSGRFAAP